MLCRKNWKCLKNMETVRLVHQREITVFEALAVSEMIPHDLIAEYIRPAKYNSENFKERQLRTKYSELTSKVMS